MPTVAFHTLGCKVNHYETEAIWQLFKEEGYDRVDFESMSDFYIINTCTVTNTGDKKSRQVIRRAIRKNPDAVICVTGCNWNRTAWLHFYIRTYKNGIFTSN